MWLVRFLCLVLIGSALLCSSTAAATSPEEEALWTHRWDELQATDMTAEQVIKSLYAASDLTPAEILQIVLAAGNKAAPNTQQALRLLFILAKQKSPLPEMIDAAVVRALTVGSNFTLSYVMSAAASISRDVVRLVVVSAIKHGALVEVAAELLATGRVVELEEAKQILIESGGDPQKVQLAFENNPKARPQQVIKPNPLRRSVSPAE